MRNVNLTDYPGCAHLDSPCDCGQDRRPEWIMAAEELQACCLAAREAYLKRIAAAITSYPVIKSFPCPRCQRIVPVRVYGPPSEAGETV